MIFIPRLVVGAPQGRSGKTTLTMGLLSALVKVKGLKVQPFKKGPDFIDPGWLAYVAGRTCRNLDSFLISRKAILESFINNCKDADLCVVEGAMGLYDGVDLEGSGSTAEIAKIIKAPVILVVNCTRMTRSVAAMTLGYMHFDREIKIAGVILNNVARQRHEKMLRLSIEKYCGIPVLGVIPKGQNIVIPDRHLGLITVGECNKLLQKVEEIGYMASQYLDLDGLLKIAREAPALEEEKKPYNYFIEKEKVVRIGIFKDRVFTFYYPENLEALECYGAELIFIDSLSDNNLPQVDALYIGGGFPEVFAAELEDNRDLRAAVKEAIEKGLPVYAECGGLIYLARRLTWQGRTYKMSGALPFDVVMSERPHGHGYEVVEVTGQNPFFPVGVSIKAHEFHHSQVVNLDLNRVSFAFHVLRGWGIDGKNDGLVYKNVLACYAHIHALSVTDWASWFIKSVKMNL